jgi:hypothetical protein
MADRYRLLTESLAFIDSKIARNKRRRTQVATPSIVRSIDAESERLQFIRSTLAVSADCPTCHARKDP